MMKKIFFLNIQYQVLFLISEFLKDAFHKSLEPEFGDQFYVMLLVARQITQFNEKLFGSYSTWYALRSAGNQTLWTRFISQTI